MALGELRVLCLNLSHIRVRDLNTTSDVARYQMQPQQLTNSCLQITESGQCNLAVVEG